MPAVADTAAAAITNTNNLLTSAKLTNFFTNFSRVIPC